jgi:ketosteroid isomerase-like protein
MRNNEKFFHPPLEGGSKNSKNFSGRGTVATIPLPEIFFSLMLKDNFHPPSRGGWNRIFAISLAIIGVGLATSMPSFAAEDTTALIKRQSQEFSDASATGNAAAFQRLLDDHVTFINEGGETATKKDIVGSAGPLPKGIENHLVQTDFHVQLYGTVAVTSFTDVQTELAHGQTFHAKYRSTEVWLKEGADWRMISSQTIALADDPPSVVLSDKELGDYVGTYSGGPDFMFKIARNGSGLTGTLGSNPTVAMKAEVRDVLFTPGQPRLRRIFQRDAQGKITGFVSRREGHDLVFKRVG